MAMFAALNPDAQVCGSESASTFVKFTASVVHTGRDRSCESLRKVWKTRSRAAKNWWRRVGLMLHGKISVRSEQKSYSMSAFHKL